VFEAVSGVDARNLQADETTVDEGTDKVVVPDEIMILAPATLSNERARSEHVPTLPFESERGQ
jgi:hypothetical protein